MHVRVFFPNIEDTLIVQNVQGTRFQRSHNSWKWKGLLASRIISLPVSELLRLMEASRSANDPKTDLPLEAICTRLGYLRDVGLDYLSLDRTSRSLSGGETQRINLTACLGAGLTDTLFALDEPTIGLHHQDVGRLIGILRDLAESGNCVCVVEHDDQVIRCS